MGEFEELVNTHQKRVYNICLRLCGNPDDAFDLSQEVFLKAWRGLEGFRGDSEASTWLYRLAVNACTDFLRRKTRRGISVSLEDSEIPLPDARYEPSIALERKDLAEAIEAALGKLSSEHKKIITLREAAGLTYGEIANLLDIEEGTVKSRLARARLTLREILIKSGNELPYLTSNKHHAKNNIKKGGGGNV
jgi:RNA polymerase sigma-70 factor (ECF subfamily)